VEELTAMISDADRISSRLKGYFNERIRRNEPLAAHTALGVGGPADLWISLSSIQELTSLARLCAQEQIPLLVIGSGHSTLFPDAGVHGIVACLGTAPVVQEEAEGGNALVLVEAGSRWSQLEQQGYVCRWGTRLDRATTLGGSVASLDAAALSGVAHHVRWIEILDARGCHAEDEEGAAIPQVRRYALDELDLEGHFARSRRKRRVHFDALGRLVIPARGLIEPAELLLRLAIVLTRETLPHELQQESGAGEAQERPTFRLGPLFRDAGTQSAGDLIASVGLAGFTLGNMQIAPQDANTLLNLGGAQASDALTLLEVIHQTVLEQRGVDLALALDVYGESLVAQTFSTALGEQAHLMGR
jgi:UDP-N-acetylmuramate dehydrogenase